MSQPDPLATEEEAHAAGKAARKASRKEARKAALIEETAEAEAKASRKASRKAFRKSNVETELIAAEVDHKAVRTEERKAAHKNKEESEQEAKAERKAERVALFVKKQLEESELKKQKKQNKREKKRKRTADAAEAGGIKKANIKQPEIRTETADAVEQPAVQKKRDKKKKRKKLPSIVDKLNHEDPAYDPVFKKLWEAMSKKERAQCVREDQQEAANQESMRLKKLEDEPNDGEESKVVSEAVWRSKSLAPRSRRLLNHYAAHFLALIQREIDADVGAAWNVVESKPPGELAAEGTTILSASPSLVRAKGMTLRATSSAKEIVPVPVLMRVSQNTYEDQQAPRNSYEASFQHRIGDLCWLRQHQKYEEKDYPDLPLDFQRFSCEALDANTRSTQVLQGVVDAVGEDWISVVVRCPLTERGAIEERFALWTHWRIDRSTNLTAYLRMRAAITAFAGRDFALLAPIGVKLQHLVARLFPYAMRNTTQSGVSFEPGEVDADGVYETAAFAWPNMKLEPPFVADLVLGSGDNVPTEASLERFVKRGKDKMLKSLNDSQRDCVRSMRRRCLTVVQGPPGTGKTTMAVGLVEAVVRALRPAHVSPPALVCAFSNAGADQLLSGLVARGLLVVRIGDNEKVRPELRSHTLRARLDRHPEAEALLRLEEQLIAARARGGGGGNRELSELYKSKQKLAARIESEIIQTAEVICSTCIGAGASCIENVRFPLVLVDECTQAPEPAVLVPIVKCMDRAVLIGDHRQLPPTLTHVALQHSSLSISLFERMLDVCNPRHPEHASAVASRGEQSRAYTNPMGVVIDRLDTQYRMHPLISSWPNATFYGGRIQDGISADSRVPPAGFAWPTWQGGREPSSLASVAFIPVKGEEGKDAGSIINLAEAERVVAIVAQLLERGIAESDVGVVTPYSGQVRLLRRLLGSTVNNNSGHRLPGKGGLEVASVDGYQGREKEVVILSCVRSSRHGGIGFLADPRRLNVALTRAKRGLIVIGDRDTLSRNPVWANWLKFAEDAGLIV